MQRPVDARLTRAVDFILACGGFACVLAVLYVAYHYGWTKERHFTTAIGPILYYGGPAVLSVLLFSSLRLPASIKVKLALVAVSTACSLLALEVVIRALQPEPTLHAPATKQALDEIVRIAARFGVDYDTRTGRQVVMDLRSKGVDAVPGAYPYDLLLQQPDGTLKSRIAINQVETLTLGGISNRLTVLCNESGEWITYQSDEHGFQNPPGIWSSGTIDIAVLGDSFVHGVCVPSEQSLVAVIRARYPATLNLGYASKGSLTALAGLKEYAAKFKPAIVLWFLYEANDFADLQREANSPLLRRYLDGQFTQGLIHAQAAIDTALEEHLTDRIGTIPLEWPDEHRGTLSAVIRLEHLRQRAGLTHGAGRSGPNVDPRTVSDQTMELLARVLFEARNTVDTWGGKLYLVYLPERDRYVHAQAARLDEFNRARVLNMTRSLGIEVIDIAVAFQTHGDPLALFPFRRGSHYTGEGYRLVGETVLSRVSTPLLK